MYKLDSIYYSDSFLGFFGKLKVVGHNPLFPNFFEEFDLNNHNTQDIIAGAANRSLPLFRRDDPAWDRSIISIRGEVRLHSKNIYWYGYKKVAGKLKKVYIGRELNNQSLKKAIDKFESIWQATVNNVG